MSSRDQSNYVPSDGNPLPLSFHPEEAASVAQLKSHIMAIAQSPLFAYQARLAHAVGLLGPLLSRQQLEVNRVSDGLLSILSEDQFQRHQPVRGLLRILAGRRETCHETAVGSSMETAVPP